MCRHCDEALVWLVPSDLLLLIYSVELKSGLCVKREEESQLAGGSREVCGVLACSG